MKFIDSSVVELRSGDGGRGHVSFRREKFVPNGGPDGGDGGDGGNLVLVGNPNISTLLDFKYVRKYEAGDGVPGGKSNKIGKRGKDKVIKVPVGTQVFNEETGELLADIDKPHVKVILLKGGRGGKGNAFFVSATRQAPRYAQPGTSGEEVLARLELKLLADVGLVGKPNAGKSTLISVLSAAKPKVADYPFTTLVPHLGIVKVDEENNFTMADIPGLIEGASEGKGLGFQFLKHIERTATLLYMIDINTDDPVAEYELLKNELHSYSDFMEDKEFKVALTKADSTIEEQLEYATNLKFDGKKSIIISSVAGKNIDQLKRELWESIKTQRKFDDNENQEDIPTIEL
ncbi:MAG: GTPase ObgE [Candidatus Kapaibacteriales bacterium]